MRLAGRVAIVTGAGRGVGRAIALAFGREGCRLALAARSADELVRVANEVQNCGQQAIAVATDVTDESAVGVLIERTKAVFGRIDILVNAAALPAVGAYADIETPEWDSLIATNLRGPHFCMRGVVPIMLAQAAGMVINVVERNPFVPGKFCAVLSAAHSGVLGLTRTLAVELGDSGIRVNALCSIRARTNSEDAAAAAVFLAASKSVNGEVIEMGQDSLESDALARRG